ncbi:hypothetical protein [Streptomyces sp. NPDC054854]
MVRVAVGHVVVEAGPSSAGGGGCCGCGWGCGVTLKPFGGLPYLIQYVQKGKGRGGIVRSG